jgi:hypothetical protein
MGTPVLFEELTLDVALELAKTRGIIIFPVATTEAHGNHLPLGTEGRHQPFTMTPRETQFSEPLRSVTAPCRH